MDQINKACKWSLVLSLFISLLLGIFSRAEDSIALMFGSIWGCCNVLMIKHLFQSLLLKSKKPLHYAGLFAIKFPLLYGVGYALLATTFLPIENLILGSLLVFVLFFFLKLQKRTAFLGMFLCSFSLHAGFEQEVPEVPSFITLIYKGFEGAAWAAHLQQIESLILSLIAACCISFLFYFGSKKKELIPGSLQNFLELVVDSLRTAVVDIIGLEGEKFVPFLGTTFVYILTMNWFGLVPLLRAPSSNLNITAALAICVFVLVQYENIKNYGFLGFIYHLAGSPKTFGDWLLVPILFPIEILTQFTRPLTLALRLFGNIIGEGILIGAAALFGVLIFAESHLPIGLPLQIPFVLLALLTGAMQALVFTLLSSIYILLSMKHDDKTASI